VNASLQMNVIWNLYQWYNDKCGILCYNANNKGTMGPRGGTAMTLYYNRFCAEENLDMLHDVQQAFACNRIWMSDCMEPPYTCPQKG